MSEILDFGYTVAFANYWTLANRLIRSHLALSALEIICSCSKFIFASANLLPAKKDGGNHLGFHHLSPSRNKADGNYHVIFINHLVEDFFN